MKRYKNASERVPFYYRYFGTLIDNNIEKKHAKEIADELGFKSANSVVRDFQGMIENAGSANYGYNSVFMYNSLKKLMHIHEMINVAVIGPEIAILKNSVLPSRGFKIIGKMDTYNKVLIEENDISVIVVTDPKCNELNSLPECVKVIINMSGNKLMTYGKNVHIEDVDLLELLTNAWYLKMKEDAE